MEILVNGAPHDLEEGTTVTDLIARIGVGTTLVAVEINRVVLPREEFASRVLSPGDRVEILRLVGGG